MSTTKLLGTLILAAPSLLLAQAGPARAQSIDGTANLICFAETTTYCETGGACEAVRAEDLDLPKFFRIDFTAMAVSRKTGDDSERTSKIASMTQGEDGLLLQGNEEGMGWTLLVEAGGNMSVSATRAGEAFVVFGACTTN